MTIKLGGNKVLPLLVPRGSTWGRPQLTDSARLMGIAIMAGKGSGKSRIMGRLLAFLDFLRLIPVVILDPVGGTIDNFLDKVIRLPKDEQIKAWKRIIYVDPSGRSGHIVPFPLYYRFGKESLYEVAQRYLDVLKKLDPHLIEAPVTGWNAVHRMGTMMGMTLGSLDCQIPEGAHLLNNPQIWLPKVEGCIDKYPELADVYATLSTFSSLKGQDKQREKDSLLNKINIFALEPSMKAMFGAGAPGVNWHEVVSERKTVLFDLRHIQDNERKRFLIWWFYDYFIKFVKYRGHGNHTPISFIIDELTSFLGGGSNTEEKMFAEELNNLINVVSRSHRIWLTIALQEAWQVDEKILKSLMTIGTQVMGATSDPETALRLAKTFYRYDPGMMRKTQNVYMSDLGKAHVIDQATTEYSLDEQFELHSAEIRKQGLFKFLVRFAKREGDPHGEIRSVSFANLDKGQWVNEEAVTWLRNELSSQTGRPINDLLSEVERRRAAVLSDTPFIESDDDLDEDDIPSQTLPGAIVSSPAPTTPLPPQTPQVKSPEPSKPPHKKNRRRNKNRAGNQGSEQKPDGAKPVQSQQQARGAKATQLPPPVKADDFWG